MSKTNLEIAKAYIALFNDPSASAASFAAFMSPDIIFEEMPNLLAPKGSKRSREEMLEGVERGKELLSEQVYHIDKAVCQEDVVALEVQWQGKLAAAFGNVAAGTSLQARIAMFITFVDGKIVHQRNYDAYDPIV
jgi:ketosteroid isomerase-like protein